MTNIPKIIGWMLGIVAVLMMIGQIQIINPIWDFGFNLSILMITTQSIVMLIAAYYLIKK